MANDNIPSWKHRGCGGAVYLDKQNGFFCRRCENKLEVPMNKVSRELLRGTPFEASESLEAKRKKEEAESLREIVSVIGEIIVS
jgi:hypothetical protein